MKHKISPLLEIPWNSMYSSNSLISYGIASILLSTTPPYGRRILICRLYYLSPVQQNFTGQETCITSLHQYWSAIALHYVRLLQNNRATQTSTHNSQYNISSQQGRSSHLRKRSKNFWNALRFEPSRRSFWQNSTFFNCLRISKKYFPNSS